jgi:hypothetical protein
MMELRAEVHNLRSIVTTFQERAVPTERIERQMEIIDEASRKQGELAVQIQQEIKDLEKARTDRNAIKKKPTLRDTLRIR